MSFRAIKKKQNKKKKGIIKKKPVLNRTMNQNLEKYVTN